MRKIKIILTIICLGLLISLPTTSIKAQLIDNPELQDTSNEFASAAGFSNIGIGSIIATLITVVLSVLALIFLVLTLVAGFKWMNAGGNEEDVKKAQASLKNAIIGLIIVLASFAITYFVFNSMPFSGGSPSSLPTPY